MQRDNTEALVRQAFAHMPSIYFSISPSTFLCALAQCVEAHAGREEIVMAAVETMLLEHRTLLETQMREIEDNFRALSDFREERQLSFEEN
jgi:hypothetical protein